jgi:Fungal specific transcription factor domain
VFINNLVRSTQAPTDETMNDLRSLLGWLPPVSNVFHASTTPNESHATLQSADVSMWVLLASIIFPRLLLIDLRSNPTILPPIEVQSSTVDLYFQYCHNQPYSFFHEESFRFQFLNELLPEYLLFAVLCLASRYSLDPFYTEKETQAASVYASKAWKEIVCQCFESEEDPDYRLVQATTLLALHEFTGIDMFLLHELS